MRALVLSGEARKVFNYLALLARVKGDIKVRDLLKRH